MAGGLFIHLQPARVLAGAAEPGLVGGEGHGVAGGVRHADDAALPGHRGEVDDDHHLLARLVGADVGDHVPAAVVGVDPLVPLPAVLDLPQGGVLLVEAVQFPDIVVQLAVVVVPQQHPIQLLLEVPFDELGELGAHKVQLFARGAHHIAQEGPGPGKLLVVVPGHPADEGALAVDHLVVADGQDVVFRKGVHHAEGEFVVVVAAEVGVGGQVGQHVVHPAHVPLEVEPQPPHVVRLGDHGPGGGFLGDHQHLGVGGQDGGVEFFEEIHRLQVLPPAKGVGGPLAVPAVVVQVEHRGHRVHPDAVDVVFFHPEQGAGDEETLDLAPAVVKDPGAPAPVLHLPGVGVLVAVAAVELAQAVLVLGEVGGDPVHDDPDARLVEGVHQVHKVLGGAVAGGGGEVPGDLVAPGAVVGVFGDRHQFHVGVAHLRHVGHQLLRQLAVVVGGAVGVGAPGAQVHLVDIDRGGIGGKGGPALHPPVVLPLVPLQPVQLGGVARAGLGVEGVGVGLEPLDVVRPGDEIFIGIVLRKAGHAALPQPLVGDPLHGPLLAPAPVVEFAHDADRLGVGGPGEKLGGPVLGHMCPKKVLGLVIGPLMEQVSGKVPLVFLLNHLHIPPFFYYSTIIFLSFQEFVV